MKNLGAIGVFDSGIGGLTVVNSLKEILPNEKIIYVGDTVHLPYGDKSAKAIKSYCKNIALFLKENNVKMIVIACNSASASGNKTVKKIAGADILVENVIDPVVEYITKICLKRVGVIGTKRTIDSNIYTKKIQHLNKKIHVKSLATPLLAPMIEEGFFNNKISQSIINSYLEKEKLKNIQGLVLGCTHYPLIKKEISSFYKNKITIFDSAKIVAEKVKSTLQKNNLLAPKKSGADIFYVTDFTHSFQKTSEIFFKKKITLKEIRTIHSSF